MFPKMYIGTLDRGILKKNAMLTRRHIISIWDPYKVYKPICLPTTNKPILQMQRMVLLKIPKNHLKFEIILKAMRYKIIFPKKIGFKFSLKFYFILFFCGNNL
jgi:hypothetical protein